MKRNHGMTHSRAFIKPKLRNLLDIDNFLQGDLISLQFLIDSNDPNTQFGMDLGHKNKYHSLTFRYCPFPLPPKY